MTTKDMYYAAFSAARKSIRFDGDPYESPTGAAMRALYDAPFGAPRLVVAIAASNAAQMMRSYRLRRNVQPMVSASLRDALMCRRARLMNEGAN